MLLDHVLTLDSIASTIYLKLILLEDCQQGKATVVIIFDN